MDRLDLRFQALSQQFANRHDISLPAGDDIDRTDVRGIKRGDIGPKRFDVP